MQQLPGPEAPRPPATVFLIPRSRPFLAFLAAVIVADVAVVAVGLRMSGFYRSLHERGQVAAARITGYEIRAAIRGPENHFYFYAYRDAAGATHTSSTFMRALDVGDTVPVTYLPESPEDHALFPMTPRRIRQPIRAAGTFAAASLTVTLLFGTLVQWAMRRRETRANG